MAVVDWCMTRRHFLDSFHEQGKMSKNESKEVKGRGIIDLDGFLSVGYSGALESFQTHHSMRIFSTDKYGRLRPRL